MRVKGARGQPALLALADVPGDADDERNQHDDQGHHGLAAAGLIPLCFQAEPQITVEIAIVIANCL